MRNQVVMIQLMRWSWPSSPDCHHLSDLLIVRIGALVKHGRKDQLRVGLVRGDQPLAVRLVHRDRLFDQHVVARVQRGDADRGVA